MNRPLISVIVPVYNVEEYLTLLKHMFIDGKMCFGKFLGIENAEKLFIKKILFLRLI